MIGKVSAAILVAMVTAMLGVYWFWLIVSIRQTPWYDLLIIGVIHATFLGWLIPRIEKLWKGEI